MKSKYIFTLAFIFLGICTYAQVFNDKPANETIGDMPSNWQLINGSSQITMFNGEQVISLNHRSIITPQIAGDSYLTDDFTLKFDAYFDELEQAVYYYQYYEIRFWEGQGNVVVPSNAGDGFYAPIKIQRNGVLLNGREGSSTMILDQNYKGQLENMEGAWRSIRIKYVQGTLTITIDGIIIINHENFMYAPQMVSIRAIHSSEKTGFIRGIKNISIIGTTNTNDEEENDDTDDGDDDGNNNDDTDNHETSTYSGLEAIDEGNGIGWRLKGRKPEFYKKIGLNAVDFSYTGGTLDYDLGASGAWSFAMGNMVKAIGNYSLAMGVVAIAKGEFSIALGNTARASGRGSIALGIESGALKDHAIAMGNEVKADGFGAISLGIESNALRHYAIAMGFNAKASGESSIALGTNSTTTKNYATAIGHNVNAEGIGTIAMGVESIASGNYAISIGSGTKATAESGTALGDRTEASGSWSTAIGKATKANGDYSTAMGYETKSESFHSFALGKYNIGFGDPTVWKQLDPLFEIGNGHSSQSSNALTVLKNGNMGITTHTPQVKLHITGGTDASLNTGGYVILGDKKGENLVFDNNEIIARNNVQPSTLYLQHNGGDVFVGGSLVHSSDERLKTNITELQYGLSTVLKLNPVSYNWKNQLEQNHQSLGLIAQEVQPLIKEIVKIGTDKDQTLSLSYTELIPILIKAIQEQQSLINYHNIQIKDLSAEITQFKELDRRLKKFKAINSNTPKK